MRIVIEAVQGNGDALEFANAAFQADQELVLEAVKRDVKAPQLASRPGSSS